jgi:hypothetical protein
LAHTAKSSGRGPAHTASLRTRAGSSRAKRSATSAPHDRPQRSKRAAVDGLELFDRVFRVDRHAWRQYSPRRRERVELRRPRLGTGADAVEQDEVAHTLVTVTDLLAYRDRFPILEHTTYL